MNPLRSIVVLPGFLILCFGVAAFGAQFKPGEWYSALVKPWWTPAPAIFPVAWTILYGLMAVSAWIVWRASGRLLSPALMLFVLQLVFNGAWSWLFFGLQSPGFALLDLGLLWMTLIATTAAFFRVSPVAGTLFVPYLAWVSYALALNTAIWWLND